jgi:hypothetical protein
MNGNCYDDKIALLQGKKRAGNFHQSASPNEVIVPIL